jgi:hypothetical protein
LELPPDVLLAPNKRLFVRGKALGVICGCLVVSDGFPHWLLALRTMDWLTIYWMHQLGDVPQPLLPLLESFLPSLQNVLSSTVFKECTFSTLVESVDVLLFSGSDAALMQVLSFKHSVPTICIPWEPAAVLH